MDTPDYPDTNVAMRRSDDGPGEYQTAPRETNQGHPRAPEVYPIRPWVETQSPDETLGEPPVTDSPAAIPQTADQPTSVLGRANSSPALASPELSE